MPKKYTCSVCKENCKTNCIYCEVCKTWLHYQCQNILSEDSNVWRSIDQGYICILCRTTGDGRLDFLMGIERLKQAAKQGIKKLASAVDREQLFLKDESFDSSLFSDFSQHNPDDVSNIILSHFHSTDKTAIECSADGDCLFNAFSICLVGNESRSLEMRYRCCIEMVSNKTRIMQHRLYPRLTIISPDFEKDCLECTKPGSYSSVWRLIALSNALNIPVKSVYPSINGTKYIPFQVLNHTFNPPFADMTKGPITIMWTNITLPDQCKRFVKLKNRKEWTPNHFVPLVNLEKQDLEKNNTDSDHSEVSICEDPENKDTKQGYVYGGRTEYDRDQTKLGKNQSDDYDNHDKDVCPENSGDSSDALSGDQRHVSILVEDDSDVDMFEARGLKDRKGMFNISLKEKKGIQVSKDIKNEILGENESDDDLDLGQNVKAEDGSSNQSGYPLPSGFLAIAVILEIFKTSYKVVERLPTYVKENVYFVVKNKTNIERRSKQQKSEFWDDCGTWTASTSPKQFFIFRNGKLLSIFKRSGIYCTEKIVKGKHIYTPLMPQPDRSEVFIAHRNYSKLKKFPAYKRRVTWFESRPKEFSYIPTDVAIIEYVGNFPGRCSHGNAKTKRTLEEGYVRTNSAVMAKLAEKVKQTNPKSVFDEMNSDKSLSEHERQRNLKQIQNIKYLKKRGARSDNSASTNMADHVIRVENMVHEHEFVQQVFTDKCKPVCIVLFTDDQIKDMKRSCCVDTGSVLAFDKTFNLGQVFVTSSVYKNTAVVRKSTNKNPIFFGPIFIHGTSDYETYNSFMQKLSVKLTDEDISNMIIGSDDETAMRKACRKAFPSARHIVCTRHLKTNTLHYLVDKVGLDRKSRSEIVNAIFGMHGLVSASDIDTFNHRLKFVKGIISKHENSKAEDKSFAKYFRTRLLPLLKEHVLVPASRKEFIEPNWTNNNCESGNFLLKLATKWQQKNLSELVEILYKVVVSQQVEYKRCLIGRGEYCLDEKFKRHRVSMETWDNLSQEQKDKLFEKFLSDKGKVNRINSKDGSLTVIAKPSAGRKPHQLKRKRAERTTRLSSSKRRYMHRIDLAPIY